MVQKVKLDKVEAIRENIKEMPNMIFTDYRGLKVSEITKLRRSLYGLGARYVVTKNRLLKIALKEVNYDGDDSALKDPTAVVYSSGFPSEVAKHFMIFRREIKN